MTPKQKANKTTVRRWIDGHLATRKTHAPGTGPVRDPETPGRREVDRIREEKALRYWLKEVWE